jgi:hypothetical protein
MRRCSLIRGSLTRCSLPGRCGLLLLALYGWFIAGCGSGTPQTIAVTGRVTFDGQAPPGPGTVWFLPQEAAEGFPSRPATGDFDKEGRYTVKTFDPGDGLMPGKYVMRVDCWQTPPNMEGKPTKSYLPSKYWSEKTSGFSVEIKPDMRAQEINLDIVTK